MLQPNPLPQVEKVYLEGKIHPISFRVHEWTYSNLQQKEGEKKRTDMKILLEKIEQLSVSWEEFTEPDRELHTTVTGLRGR